MYAGIGVAAGGVALLAVGAGMGAGAESASNDITNANAKHLPFDPARDAAGRRYQTLEAVFLAVGGAAAIAGTVVAVVGARKTNATRAALMPTFGPHGAGAALRVDF